MALPRELINEFVKMTKDDTPVKTETNTFGTVVKNGVTTYVKLDGSELLTPVITTTNVEDGERVGVMIKNHTAVITGNISSPSARTAEVEGVGEEVTQLKGDVANVKILMADKVSAEKLEAQVGRIDTLESDNVKINERLTAAEADIGKLDVVNLDAINADIKYLKSNEAFVEHLNAITARINEVVAGKITTDEFYAALADITVLAAGTATFDKATVKHLVAQAMNLDYGVGEQVFIKNLAVEFAQMVSASIGELCIKASDGNYYLLDVGADGSVMATKTAVSNSEISDGKTSGGKVILETNITAANLNTSNLLATYALVNKIDAARIDVDQLTSREAFITSLFAQEIFTELLRTSKIVGDKTLTLIAGDAFDAKNIASSAQSAASNAQSTANSASQSASNAQSTANAAQTAANSAQSAANNAQLSIDNLEVGGRNLFAGYGEEEIKLNDYLGVGSFTPFRNHLTFNPAETVGETYTVSFWVKSPNGKTDIHVYNQNGGPRYFKFEGMYLVVADDVWRFVSHTFTNTDMGEGESENSIEVNKIEIYAPSALGVLVKKIKVEKGNKATDWTPAPEDVNSDIADAKTLANNAQASVNDLNRLTDIEVVQGAFAQTTRRAGEGIHVYSEIAPKQAGSGDPYPMGGGKNLLNNIRYYDNTHTDIRIQYDNPLLLKAGVTYTLSTNIKADGLYFVDAAGEGSLEAQYLLYYQYQVASLSYTPTTDIRCIFIAIFNNGVPDGTTVQLEIGSQATDYAPPSNIRPISGWTSLNARACGKNLLPNGVNNGTYGGITLTRNADGSIGVYGTCTEENVISICGDGVQTENIIGVENCYVTLSPNFGTKVIRADGREDWCSSGTIYLWPGDKLIWAYLHFHPGEVLNHTVYPQIEKGTVATAYEPYQGDTYALDFGKNLCPVDSVENVAWAFSSEDLRQVLNSLSPGTYTFSAKWRVTSAYVSPDRTMAVTDLYGIAITKPDNTDLAYFQVQWGATGVGLTREQSLSFTITDDIAGKIPNVYLYGVGNNSIGYVGYATIFDIQIEPGSVATHYFPYNAELRDKTGGVVYGGKVDWNAGVITVEWVTVTFAGGEVVSTDGEGSGIFTTDAFATAFEAYCDNRCSHYASTRDYETLMAKDMSIAIWKSGQIRIHDSRFKSVAEINSHYASEKEAGTPVQVSYKLAEPYTIQLTPVQIETLKGANTIYTDADGGYVEFGHEPVDVCDSTMAPENPKAGKLWLDRSVTPCVLRRWTGSEWETVNDVTLIESVQSALMTKQAELEAAQRETALYLTLDPIMKAVRIGQTGLTSEARVDAFGFGVVVANEVYSRFEANRALFGNMEMRKPNVGGLAIDALI